MVAVGVKNAWRSTYNLRSLYVDYGHMVTAIRPHVPYIDTWRSDMRARIPTAVFNIYTTCNNFTQL